MSTEALEQFKKEIQKRFIKVLEAFLSFHEGRDPHHLSILSGIPPPKELIRARAKFIMKKNLTRSEKLRAVLDTLINIADRLMDLYQKPTVLIESMMKEVATSEDEIEVITD